MSQTIAMAERHAARDRQTVIGVSLALAVMVAWFATHVLAIFVIDWAALGVLPAALMVLFQAWLFVGMFIIAHDCMHGSLAPGRPWVNRLFGRVTLFLYAAFNYDKLLPEHHKHHRRPGTADDPDFDIEHPDAFWPWFYKFFRHYYGWRELLAMVVVMNVYLYLLQPDFWKVLVFYGLPAGISAFQLFFFGTYLPHRHGEDEFEDAHASRTNNFPWLVSLLTCFHFGYHHEHHLSPGTPWWRLPVVHAERLRAGA